MEWKYLQHIDFNINHKKSDLNLLPRDCHSIFADDKGILVIFSYSEVICVKLKLSSDPDRLLSMSDFGRIRGIRGKMRNLIDFMFNFEINFFFQEFHYLMTI